MLNIQTLHPLIVEEVITSQSLTLLSLQVCPPLPPLSQEANTELHYIRILYIYVAFPVPLDFIIMSFSLYVS